MLGLGHSHDFNLCPRGLYAVATLHELQVRSVTLHSHSEGVVHTRGGQRDGGLACQSLLLGNLALLGIAQLAVHILVDVEVQLRIVVPYVDALVLATSVRHLRQHFAVHSFPVVAAQAVGKLFVRQVLATLEGRESALTRIVVLVDVGIAVSRAAAMSVIMVVWCSMVEIVIRAILQAIGHRIMRSTVFPADEGCCVAV